MTYFFFAILLFMCFRGWLYFQDSRSTAFTDGDSVVHLAFLKKYYERKGKGVDFSDLYTLYKSDYPTGYHKFFYFLGLSPRFMENHGGTFSVLFDLLLLTLCFALGVVYGGGEHVWILLFPLFRIFYGHEGRASQFSERAFGVFFGALYIYSALLYVEFGEPHFAGFAVLAYLVTSVSAKFAIQAVFLYSLFFSVFFLKLAYLGLFFLSFFISCILTRGYSLDVLKGLLRHSRCYKNYFSKRNTVLRNNYAELRQAFSNLKFNLLLNNPVLKIFTDQPLSLILVVNAEQLMNIPGPWSKVVLISWLLVMLTASEALKFLGEPERYLDFALPALFVLLSNLDIEENYVAGLLSILLLFLVFFEYYPKAKKRWNWSGRRKYELLGLSEFINTLHGKIILTIPLRLSFFLGYHSDFGAGHKYVSSFGNIGDGELEKRYLRLIKDYCLFPDKDILALKEEFGFDLVVVDKEAVNHLHNQVGSYYDRFNRYEIVYENRLFLVVRV